MAAGQMREPWCFKAGRESGLATFIDPWFPPLTIRQLWIMAAQNDRSRPFKDADPHAFRPGHLFWMPSGSTWLNRDKPRPFVLATPCGEGTLIYGSTQQTEKRAGAACVVVAPMLEGLNRNRLRSRTYFYPGTLLAVRHERLPPRSGYLGKSLRELRAALRGALGVGRGSCLGPDAPAGSCRGRVVNLNAAFARRLRAAFAVVLTEPGYSAERNYQIILPIFTTRLREGSSHDLLVSARDWLGFLPVNGDRVVLPIPLTHSVWHDTHIARETEHVLDDDSLAEIDRRLCDYFALPSADGGDDAGG
jgi:hypothetical protein